MTTNRKYHHGDLRSTLLLEARNILAEESVEGLTLRRLADRTGVSRQAPYHHFKDKHVLLCALAADGFRTLESLIVADRQHADSKDALSSLVRDYLEFAHREPEIYELMFGRRIWKLSEPTAELRDIAYATFRHYVAVINGLIETNGRPLESKQGLRLAQASWATLHGLSKLSNDGIYVDLNELNDVSALAIDMLLNSLKP